MLHVFRGHIGSTVEAYVDDIVVKSKRQGDLIQDLEIAYPEKMCLWRASRHAFRIHILPMWHRGQPLESLGHHQDGADSRRQGHTKSDGCLATLSHFISRLGEKALPLYRLLKKAERFAWNVEAEEALDKLKRMLTTAPLVPPRPAKPLLLYVAAMSQVVSVAVVVERLEEGHMLLV